jgi:hypothetical protein
MREAVAAILVVEMLIQGVFFDTRRLRRLPFNKRLVERVLRALVDSRVVVKSRLRRKYILTDEFLNLAKGEVVRTMPRQLFIHCPDAAVFDISGIEDWTEEELEIYLRELRKHWREKTRPN